jgi:hypothetical protein
VEVELQADEEQQDRDTQMRQQLDLIDAARPTGADRTDQDAHPDEGDDQGLPQPIGDQSDDGRDREDRRQKSEFCASHEPITTPRCTDTTKHKGVGILMRSTAAP